MCYNILKNNNSNRNNSNLSFETQLKYSFLPENTFSYTFEISRYELKYVDM